MTDSRFIELSARERAKGLLDAGTYRELLGPFEYIMSPWLEPQNIVPPLTMAWSSPKAPSLANLPS